MKDDTSLTDHSARPPKRRVRFHQRASEAGVELKISPDTPGAIYWEHWAIVVIVLASIALAARALIGMAN